MSRSQDNSSATQPAAYRALTLFGLSVILALGFAAALLAGYCQLQNVVRGIVILETVAAAGAVLVGVLRPRSRPHPEIDEQLKNFQEQAILFETLLNSLPVCVAFKDSHGRFIRVNEAMANRLGLMEPQEALGRTHADFFESAYASHVAQLEDTVLGSGEPVLHREELEPSEDLGDAWMSISRFPLRDASGVITGTISIAQDMTARKFTEQALEGANVQLTGWLTELEQQSEQTVLLSEMSEMLQTCLDEDEATTVINRYAQILFSNGSGIIAVMKASRNHLETVAAWGTSVQTEHIFPPEHCWALRRGKLHHMSHGDNNVRCVHLAGGFEGSSLCVPMLAQGEALGVLHISRADAGVPFSPAQQRLATIFSERVGLALANLKLREQLRVQSIKDALTGLYNRRYMEESLDREIRRASRNEQSVAAIMVDLDHFKRFNDTFGHEAGDMLLREFGAIARQHIRREDIACRYGGEEFLLILPNAPLEAALERAERIREAIKRLDLKASGRSIGNVSASLGVAMFPEHAQTVEMLVKAADTALYEAKHSGRDRVVLAVETYA